MHLADISACKISANACRKKASDKEVEPIHFPISEAFREWNGDCLTLDNADNSFTFNGSGNGAVSWLRGSRTDISKYETLTLELKEPSTREFTIGLSTGGYWGETTEVKVRAGETKVVINLNDLEYTNWQEWEGEGDNRHLVNNHNGDPFDLTRVNLIFLVTSWHWDTYTQKVRNKDFYLSGPTVDTGITDVQYDRNPSGMIYDLSGRRVTPPLAPGIYIRNGKKIMIK